MLKALSKKATKHKHHVSRKPPCLEGATHVDPVKALLSLQTRSTPSDPRATEQCIRRRSRGRTRHTTTEMQHPTLIDPRPRSSLPAAGVCGLARGGAGSAQNMRPSRGAHRLRHPRPCTPRSSERLPLTRQTQRNCPRRDATAASAPSPQSARAQLPVGLRSAAPRGAVLGCMLLPSRRHVAAASEHINLGG